MPAYFPFLLGTHILLAVSLFLPSILLPFSLRARRAAEDSPNRVVRFLLLMQSNGTMIIGVGLAVTGILLVLTLGTQLLSQPWLLLALSIYAANLAPRAGRCSGASRCRWYARVCSPAARWC